QRLPVAGEHVAARDDDVDLRRSRRHRCADLAHALLERTQAGGKSSAHGGHRTPGPAQRLHRGADERVVPAHRARRELQIGAAQLARRARIARTWRAGAPVRSWPAWDPGRERRVRYTSPRREDRVDARTMSTGRSPFDTLYTPSPPARTPGRPRPMPR